MSSIKTRLAALALLAGVASGCGIQAGADLGAQEVGTGDADVIARRILDLEAMRLAGKDGVAISEDLAFTVFSRRTPTSDGVLAVEDLASGRVRDVTSPYEYIFSSYYPSGIAPDGEWVAVGTQRIGSPHSQLELIRLDGQDGRVLMTHEGPDSPVDWADAFSWSHDGTKVLTLAWMRDGSTRLEMFSREDGSGVLLKAFDWRAPAWAAFSPDDRFVAYDFQPSEDSPARDIYVLALDGSRERRLTSDPSRKTLIGWSRDGSAIYYSVPDPETRTSSVWRLPMRGERAAGPPTLVRRDIAGETFFLLKGDRIVYRIQSGANPTTWTATLDLANDRVVAPPSPFLELRGRLVNGARFDWSPDGLNFTYVRSSTGGRPAVELVVHPASGRGDERTIRLDHLEYLTGRMPFGEGAILVRGQNPKRPGYGDLARVDLASGAVTPIEDPKFDELRRGDFPVYRSFSEDLSVLYLRREGEDATEIVARDLAAGTERTLFRVETRMTRGHPRVLGPALSPDGRQLAFLVYSADATPNPARPGDPGSNELHVVPVTGGPSRVVYTGWIGGQTLNWTSDNRALVFRDVVSPGAPGGQVWKVNADGSGKSLLFSMPEGLGGLRLTPDDRRIVFTGPAERRVAELWVLENLPETRSGARSASSR
jgi:Tol biopolymer transport system component